MKTSNPIRAALQASVDALRAQATAIEVIMALGIDQEPGDGFSGRRPPPHTTTRAFNERCRSGNVAGAEKIDSIWTCSSEAWFASCRRSVPTSALGLAASTSSGPAKSDDELADAMLSNAGYRVAGAR